MRLITSSCTHLACAHAAVYFILLASTYTSTVNVVEVDGLSLMMLKSKSNLGANHETHVPSVVHTNFDGKLHFGGKKFDNKSELMKYVNDQLIKFHSVKDPSNGNHLSEHNLKVLHHALFDFSHEIAQIVIPKFEYLMEMDELKNSSSSENPNPYKDILEEARLDFVLHYKALVNEMQFAVTVMTRFVEHYPNVEFPDSCIEQLYVPQLKEPVAIAASYNEKFPEQSIPALQLLDKYWGIPALDRIKINYNGIHYTSDRAGRRIDVPEGARLVEEERARAEARVEGSAAGK